MKIGDKLSDLEKTILKAVLVVNMGRMAFRDKDDAIMAIRYCSNVTEDEVKHALKSLEEMHGVVAFDEHAKTYDLIAEANGFNEFKRIFAKYRLGVKSTIDDLDEAVLTQISLITPVETSFGQDNQISTTEWGFARLLIDAAEISDSYLRSAIKSTTENCDGEKLRGVLIYAYCHENPEREIERITGLYKILGLKNYPIIILFLNDSEGEILTALTVKKALQKFSVADKERFRKHIADQQRAQNNKIIRKFTSSVAQRSMITETGIETYSVRINVLCTQCFARLFTKTVPFPFDGFENKVKTQAKGTLTSICVGLLNQTLMNSQVYSSLTPKDKNRVVAVMSTKSSHSWKIFDDNCRLVDPGHPIVRNIVSEVVQKLESGERYSVFALFGNYLLAPYGLNDNALALLVSYFVAYYGNRYTYSIANERLSERHWSDSKGKLKLPEIRKICIQKNANVNVDLVGELCKKILVTTAVEQCVTLKNELEALLLQEGETPENKLLVAQAKLHLDEGIRLRKVIYDKTASIQATIDELKKKFNVPAVIKVLGSIPTLSQFIEEGRPFIYSDNYRQVVENLRSEVKGILNKSYLLVIQKMKCDITQLSQYKSSYARYAKVLRENGMEELAVATEKRVQELETELLAKQHYESSLVECEKDLTLSGSVNKYRECEELRSKLSGWVTFFNNAKDLPVAVSGPLRVKIDEALAQLGARIEKITEEYQLTVGAVSDAKTVADLRRIDSKMDQLAQRQLPDEWTRNILVLRDSISKAIAFIESLPHDLDTLVHTIAQISENEYPHCVVAIRYCAEAAKSDLEKAEKTWVDKYITVAEQSYQAMTPHECTTWIERTRTLPEYLGNESKQKYSRIKALIEHQLHAARVDGVLSMYDALTPNEKEEFKKLLARR